MPSSPKGKSIEMYREAMSKVAPFATAIAARATQGNLAVQNVKTDPQGRVAHVEGVDHANGTAVVLDLSYEARTFTVSTGATPANAAPDMNMKVLPTQAGGRQLQVTYPSNGAMNITCDIEPQAGSTDLNVRFSSGGTVLSGTIQQGSKANPQVISDIKDFLSKRPNVGAAHDYASLIVPFAPQLQKRFAPMPAVPGGPIGGGPVATPLFWKCLAVGIVGDLICGVVCGVAAHLLCDEGEAR